MDWYSQYKIEKNDFFSFLHNIKKKYNKRSNPFHNFQHGISVMQCSYAFTNISGIA